MTLAELKAAHIALKPSSDAYGYLHDRCTCGSVGPSCAYPAEVEGDHRDHLMEAIGLWLAGNPDV